MELEVFIGDLEDDLFDYENGDYNGNIPKRISMFFPKSHSTFHFILQKIEDKEIEGKQTDWGAWVALLYLHEMKDLLKGFYNEADFKVVEKEMIKLDANKKYALVACEMI
ncbi:hypothetical protein [Salinicoccus roseus]|uniref:hypothetical protein n=1 Tax=Salinicoccus roseus TaxID=45670 RepID=UPI000F4FBD9B|nr:hypothetical protein [Salinicoccus roseus]RPE52886.1 hypothetical protein EDC33_1662 [Salinicoccus roseus]GGA72580.1 hypothetical protein GCM10007176_15920 [Salinicoccus roseus]